MGHIFSLLVTVSHHYFVWFILLSVLFPLFYLYIFFIRGWRQKKEVGEGGGG